MFGVKYRMYFNILYYKIILNYNFFNLIIENKLINYSNHWPPLTTTY